jgi:hypothetical protein
MRNRLAIAAASLVAVATLAMTAAPASARAADHANVAFGVVRLTGAQEVSPTGEVGVGDPNGRGTFGYVAFDSQLCYFLTARKLSATPVAAHIHAAPRGVNGGIVIALMTPDDGFSADCIQAVPDTTPNSNDVLLQSELDGIIANPAGFYANVHTGDFPAGAIRGQLK